MKLLIVDDEELTRIGLTTSIDWTSLGIREIIQADDGLHGIEAAHIHKPEIILCDVRMPRMDGIQMLQEIETFLPDTVSIFMSGYSDKEYLKAAIKLKAVSYIEKPLNPQEVREAILNAKILYEQKRKSHDIHILESYELSQRLALKLTMSHNLDAETIHALFQSLSYPVTPSTSFTAFIIKTNFLQDSYDFAQREPFQNFTSYLKPLNLRCLYTEKKLQYAVYFVLGSSFSPVTRQRIGNFLIDLYKPYGKFILAAGDSYTGYENANKSYSSAVILLQNGFFFPNQTFLTTDLIQETASLLVRTAPVSPELLFEEALNSKNQHLCEELLEQCFSYYNKNTSVLPNQVKDIYYKMLLSLENASKKEVPSHTITHDSIVELIEHCFYYSDLQQLVLQYTKEYFRNILEKPSESTVILQIKEFISQHYMDESLSVKDISNHVYLSTSYVCTFFKNETGKTLNQYLTEYRMERAKQLLLDCQYRIHEISSMVGYSDGHYFGKSFKKYSGFSPSEFREKMLS